MEGKKFYIRSAVVTVISVVAVLFFVALLYHYQVAVGVDEDTLTAINTVSASESTPAARGLITDRNGEVLVGNHTEYQVTLSVSDPEDDYPGQAETVLRLLEICLQCDQAWKDTEMPISQTAPYTYTAGDEAFFYVDSDTGETVETRLGRLCDAMGWEQSEDAGDLLVQMRDTFGLGDNVNDGTARSVLGVLYSCYLREKEILWTEYVFAEDVGIELISIVEEENLPGVTVSSVTARQFNTDLAAHLLGQVGYITAENWDAGENYQAQGYAMDAVVGLSGVEYAFESYLQGTPGTRTVTTNTSGDVISEEDTVPALAGSDVALTLDMELQAATEEALDTYTPRINGGEGGSAAVAIAVEDSSVLACASWPTFDAATHTYDEAYADLSPLFNRALQGTYAPGSTYKMVTATAGLETGCITVDTQIYDSGYIDYYGTEFRCWLYRQSGGSHGYETVSDAIRDSCNVFFYTVGMDVGIDTLTEYAQAFGLGVSSGIELTESTGINAGPEYSASVGATWYGGNTLSAAIGQSDNLFTPLQLANYVATLVNGGTRHAAHLLQSVTDADGTVTAYEPEVLNTVEISEENLAAMKEGMREAVTSSATVSEAFSNLNAHGITVGAKTGSAQVDGQDANGLFVCFAPYDDPEIAICVAVEQGGAGADTAVIAARMLEAYFGIESPAEDEEEDPEGGINPDAGNTDASPQTANREGTAAGQQQESASQVPQASGSQASSPQTAESGGTTVTEESGVTTEEPASEPAEEPADTGGNSGAGDTGGADTGAGGGGDDTGASPPASAEPEAPDG